MPCLLVRYHKCAVASFLAGAFILSLLSDLDCIFIRVDVGFVPVNIPEDDFNSSSSVFGLGIWSFEDPKSAQVCVFPNFDGKDNHQGLTEDDHVYDNFLVAGDAFFTTIRIFAMFSMLVGLALVTYAWTSVFSIFKNTKKNLITITLTVIMFICEGLKIGLFFLSTPCTANDFWEGHTWVEDNPDEIVKFEGKADQCLLGRGGYMSIVSLLIFFSVLVYAILVLSRDYSHHGEDGIAYDEISMPSFLNSIGQSTVSSSKVSGNSRSNVGRGSSRGANSSADGGPNTILTLSTANSS